MSSIPSAILVPDLHQNLDFLYAVIDHLKARPETPVVFMGDYFDAYERQFENEQSLRDFCANLMWLQEQSDKNITWLAGNHDIHYFAAMPEFHPEAFGGLRANRVFAESLAGFSWKRAELIAEELNPRFFKDLQLVTEIAGYCLTHAGIHPKLWSTLKQADAPLLHLANLWEENVSGLLEGNTAPVLMTAGKSRGGSAYYGGPLWLDWDSEFADIEDLPQIVGHTKGLTLRKNGNSWCIDCSQTSIVHLMPDGSLLQADIDQSGS